MPAWQAGAKAEIQKSRVLPSVRFARILAVLGAHEDGGLRLGIEAHVRSGRYGMVALAADGS